MRLQSATIRVRLLVLPPMRSVEVVSMLGMRLSVANQKAERIFRYHQGFWPRNLNQQEISYFRLSSYEITRLLGIYRKTKVMCSSGCCGNPRKYGEFTQEELRDRVIVREQMLELKQEMDYPLTLV